MHVVTVLLKDYRLLLQRNKRKKKVLYQVRRSRSMVALRVYIQGDPVIEKFSCLFPRVKPSFTAYHMVVLYDVGCFLQRLLYRTVYTVPYVVVH
jgi:hypothetical protein